MAEVKVCVVKLPNRKSYDPLVWRLMGLMKLKGTTPRKISPIAGVDHKTITSWFGKRRSPTLMNFRAVANSLGYELVLVRKEEVEQFSCSSKVQVKAK